LRISLENDTFDHIPHNKEIVKDNESLRVLRVLLFFVFIYK